MKSFILILALTCSLFCEKLMFIEPPIDFPNTPVKVALETVFLKTGIQYSIDVDDIGKYGNVTLTITQRQELDTLLLLILEPKNLKFARDAHGIYHISNAPVPIWSCGVRKLYPLTYVSAPRIVRQIKSVLTNDGVVSADIPTNSLLICDNAEVFEGIESLLKKIDVPEKDPDIQLGLLFVKNELLVKGGTLPVFPEVKELMKSGKIPDAYMFELLAKEKTVTEGEFIVKNSKVNVKCSVSTIKWGSLNIALDITLAGSEIFPGTNKIKTEISVNNGETYPVIKTMSDGKSYGLYVTASVKDCAPPRCKNTPWISEYEVSIPETRDVLINWKLDLPFSANGISHYRAYRDTKPITDVKDMKPLQDFIDGGSNYWLDTSPKDKGRTYYYFVTAVNPTGMEQAIDPSGKYCAVITIPER